MTVSVLSSAFSLLSSAFSLLSSAFSYRMVFSVLSYKMAFSVLSSAFSLLSSASSGHTQTKLHCVSDSVAKNCLHLLGSSDCVPTLLDSVYWDSNIKGLATLTQKGSCVVSVLFVVSEFPEGSESDEMKTVSKFPSGCEDSDEIKTVSKFTSGCEDRDLDSWLPRTEISILTVDELLLLSPSLEAIVTSSDGLL